MMRVQGSLCAREGTPDAPRPAWAAPVPSTLPQKLFAKKLSKIHIYLTVIAEKSIIQIGFCYKDKVNKIKRIYNENMGFLLCYSGTTHFQSVFA